MNRKDRINLQSDDKGDPNDTVWFFRSPDNKHYHNDEDCRLINEGTKTKPTSRQGAWKRWLAPCRICVL